MKDAAVYKKEEAANVTNHAGSFLVASRVLSHNCVHSRVHNRVAIYKRWWVKAILDAAHVPVALLTSCLLHWASRSLYMALPRWTCNHACECSTLRGAMTGMCLDTKTRAEREQKHEQTELQKELDPRRRRSSHHATGSHCSMRLARGNAPRQAFESRYRTREP